MASGWFAVSEKAGRFSRSSPANLWDTCGRHVALGESQSESIFQQSTYRGSGNGGPRCGSSRINNFRVVNRLDSGPPRTNRASRSASMRSFLRLPICPLPSCPLDWNLMSVELPGRPSQHCPPDRAGPRAEERLGFALFPLLPTPTVVKVRGLWSSQFPGVGGTARKIAGIAAIPQWSFSRFRTFSPEDRRKRSRPVAMTPSLVQHENQPVMRRKRLDFVARSRDDE
jgi:hypothetical protein